MNTYSTNIKKEYENYSKVISVSIPDSNNQKYLIDIIMHKNVNDVFNHICTTILRLQYKKVMIVTDHNVYTLYQNQFKEVLKHNKIEYSFYVCEPGENSKSVQRYEELIEILCDCNIGRKDLILSFGGGVIGDLAGFAASTFKRGIDFIQIPTTVLSQVDSSVGSKVAINSRRGKNLIGSFYHPKYVFIASVFLKTLDYNTFKEGFGEVIKTSFLMNDESLYSSLLHNNLKQVFEACSLNQFDLINEMIQSCILFKCSIVESDPYEKNERAILNFGHTFGHAIEHCYGGVYKHGEAISIGMILISQLGLEQGIGSKKTLDTLRALLTQWELPTQIDKFPEINITYEKVCDVLLNDKKASSSTMQVVFLDSRGTPRLENISSESVLNFLKKIAF